MQMSLFFNLNQCNLFKVVKGLGRIMEGSRFKSHCMQKIIYLPIKKSFESFVFCSLSIRVEQLYKFSRRTHCIIASFHALRIDAQFWSQVTINPQTFPFYPFFLSQ